MPPQNQSDLSIAPLKIIEHYEAFKKAIKNGDILLAEKNIKEMKTYQGGEKLAKELDEEFEEFQKKNLLKNNKEQYELIQENYDLLEEEENNEQKKSQEILGHIEAFETFLNDEFFDFAEEEINEIIRLKDKDIDLANKLKLRLKEEKDKAEKRNKGEIEKKEKYQKVSNEESKKIKSTKILNKIIFLAETSLNKARDYFDSNTKELLEKDYEKALESFHIIEEERKKKIFVNFNKALEDEMIVAAKSILDKSGLPITILSDLYKKLEEKSEEIKEKKNLQKKQSLLNDFEWFIQKEDFDSARSVLKKLSSYILLEKFKVLENELMDAETKVQIRNKIINSDEIEKSKRIISLLEDAKSALDQNNFSKTETLINKLEALDKEAFFYLTNILVEKKEEIEIQKLNKIKISWKEKFRSSLTQSDNNQSTELLKEAKKYFSKNEFLTFEKQLKEKIVFDDFMTFLKDNNFSDAEKLLKNKTLSLSLREKMLIKFGDYKNVYEKIALQKELNKIQENIDKYKLEKLFDKAIQESDKLLKLKNSIADKELKKSLNKAKEEITFQKILNEIETRNFESYLSKKHNFSLQRSEQLFNAYQKKSEEVFDNDRKLKLKTLKLSFERACDTSYEKAFDIFEKIQLIATREELPWYQEKLQESKEMIIQNNLNESESLLQSNSFIEVRQIIENFIKLKYYDLAESLLKKCLEKEYEQKKQKIKDVLEFKINKIKEHFSKKDFDGSISIIEQIILITKKDEFLEILEKTNQLNEFKNFLEKRIITLLEHEEIKKAKDYLKIFEIIDLKNSENLKTILREKEDIIIEKGSFTYSEITHTESILKHYNLWKKNPSSDRKHIDAIKRLGEKDFADFLLKYQKTLGGKISPNLEKWEIYMKDIKQKIKEEKFQEARFELKKAFILNFPEAEKLYLYIIKIEGSKSEEKRLKKFSLISSDLIRFLEHKNFEEIIKIIPQVKEISNFDEWKKLKINIIKFLENPVLDNFMDLNIENIKAYFNNDKNIAKEIGDNDLVKKIEKQEKEYTIKKLISEKRFSEAESLLHEI